MTRRHPSPVALANRVITNRLQELLQVLTTMPAGTPGTPDRAEAEQLLRLLGAVEALHQTHHVDRRGRCQACAVPSPTWTRPWHRDHTCTVHAVLTRYLTGASVTSIGHPTTAQPDS